jgi:hypothetical protein
MPSERPHRNCIAKKKRKGIREIISNFFKSLEKASKGKSK